MSLKIISADERQAAKSGIKGVVFGPAKIGKTSLLYTLDPKNTLFVDLEAGDLSVRGDAGLHRGAADRHEYPDLLDRPVVGFRDRQGLGFG